MQNNYGKSWRAFFAYFIFFAVIFTLVARLFYIQINEGHFLGSKGSEQLFSTRIITPLRAGIYDRNNFPLAVSIKQYNLYVLSNFSIKDYTKLASAIPLKMTYEQAMSSGRKNLLLKNIDFSQYEKIKSLRIDSLEIESFQKRFYPLGDQISTLVGFVGKDGIGLEGLERSLDASLVGSPGNETITKNAKQQVIKRPINNKEGIPAENVILTIDSRVQFYSYKHLSSFIEANKAKAGSIIVLDNHSGEILAVASYPSYNPNNPNRSIQRNRALLDAIEPGSIIKPLLLAKALDLGVVELNEIIDTTPGNMTLNNKTIADPKNLGKLSYKEVIGKSSQVGASKLALHIGVEAINSGYRSFGLAVPPAIYFPGIAYGRINNRDNISDHEIASLGFGYGLKTSPLQLAQAYSIFANKGVLKDFKLFLNNEINFEQQIISKETANKVLDALEYTVTDGTGSLAKVKGYRVGGKTGTAHNSVGSAGYSKDKYIASFAGIVPLDSNRLTIFVRIIEPGLNNYSGGVVAAPLFSAIAKDVLNYLDE